MIPGRSDRAPEQGSALADDRGSAAMFALPDPSVIARLANEFFAALPASAAVPENAGASAPARATTGDVPAVSSFAPAPAGVTALTATIPNVPESPAAPGSLAYFLDCTSPLNATPTLPSLNEAFAFQTVPGAQPLPGIPGMPASAPSAPLTETDLRAFRLRWGAYLHLRRVFPPLHRRPRRELQRTFSISRRLLHSPRHHRFPTSQECFPFPAYRACNQFPEFRVCRRLRQPIFPHYRMQLPCQPCRVLRHIFQVEKKLQQRLRRPSISGPSSFIPTWFQTLPCLRGRSIRNSSGATFPSCRSR